MRTLTAWLNYVRSMKADCTDDAKKKRGLAEDEAYVQHNKNMQAIKRNFDRVLQEANNFMKDEESRVLSLQAEGEKYLPDDIAWPSPMGVSDFYPFEVQRQSETDSSSSSVDWSPVPIKSSESPNESDNDHEHFQINPLTTELPSRPSVKHSILPGWKFVNDVAYSAGFSMFTARDEGRDTLFQIEFDGTAPVKFEGSVPVKISASFDCSAICLVGSGELLVTEANWKEDNRKAYSSNKVRRFRLMEEGESKAKELNEPHEVEGGKHLCGLASSPEGLVAVCDYDLNRITVHSTNPWSRVDTIYMDCLLARARKVSQNTSGNRLLPPFAVTWLNKDELCAKLSDNQTIICVSLKLKEIQWTTIVPSNARLLSSAYGRVYVSHWDSPVSPDYSIARFTVLRADTGETLNGEQLSFPGQRTLKVFPSPSSEEVVAFTM